MFRQSQNRSVVISSSGAAYIGYKSRTKGNGCGAWSFWDDVVDQIGNLGNPF